MPLPHPIWLQQPSLRKAQATRAATSLQELVPEPEGLQQWEDNSNGKNTVVSSWPSQSFVLLCHEVVSLLVLLAISH